MWIVKLALRRPHTFIVAALLILVFGILSARSAPDLLGSGGRQDQQPKEMSWVSDTGTHGGSGWKNDATELRTLPRT